MIFKNRVQRDIQDFKDFKEASDRRTKERSEQPEAASIGADGERQFRVMADSTLERMLDELQKDTSVANTAPQSVVSTDATWEGTLRSEGSIKVGGKIAGEIEAGDTLYVAVGARIKANVRARRVIVGGELEGNINCQEELVVEGSGRLGGKVNTATLIVEEGAVVRGEIEMLRSSARRGSRC